MKNALNSITITPETHWDREWYLTFDSYRAKLVELTDQLLDILDKDPSFRNWSFDGQTIVLEDYLEIRPEREKDLEKYIKEGKISVGPMYILPDEYLVSGESLIRNFMLGIKIARKYHREMKCAYIPDPFGHIAQLPQLVSGFELPAVMMSRGFGEEVKDSNLDVEFVWEAPNNAASTICVHLRDHYDNVSQLSDAKDSNGIYKKALSKVKSAVDSLAKGTATGEIVLCNGSDHLFPQPHIPEIVRQWNDTKKDNYPEMIQGNFGEYALKLPAYKEKLKHYSGELHSAKYQYILSGVFSARMWIKQQNWLVQNLMERYAEPITAIISILFPKSKNRYAGLLWKAWRDVLQNHPHDSICGCSIDEVHDIDMRARFLHAKDLSTEIFKSNILRLATSIDIDELEGERIALLCFNPHPWQWSATVEFSLLMKNNIFGKNSTQIQENFEIKDSKGKSYPFHVCYSNVEPRFLELRDEPYKVEFFTSDIPPLGYKIFYLYPGEEPAVKLSESEIVQIETNSIENQYYRLTFHENGSFDVFDKESEVVYPDQGILEDTGDWGDEYDFSWARRSQTDLLISTEKSEAQIKLINKKTIALAEISHTMQIPFSLDEQNKRKKRHSNFHATLISLRIELPFNEKIIRISGQFENRCKDHRLRILFPSGIQSDRVYVDGHFHIIPREIKVPKGSKTWIQRWQPTHHQNKFVLVQNENCCFMVMNRGLPEYEARGLKNRGLTFAITILRSVGWLSRGDFISRSGAAGPPLSAPGAQCLGPHHFEVAITSSNAPWNQSEIYRTAEQYNNPVKLAIPGSIQQNYRRLNIINLSSYSTFVPKHPEDTKLLPSEMKIVDFDNSLLAQTAFKMGEDGESIVLRVVNLSDNEEQTIIGLGFAPSAIQIVNLNEEEPIHPIKSTVKLEGSSIMLKIGASVITTIKIFL